MITVDAWTTIRYLHAQGKPIRRIAKELGLSRNTVRDALRRDSVPRYMRAKRPNPKLDPYLGRIEEMCLQKRFIGSRILRELRSMGYTGGHTAVYAFLRTLKGRKVDSRVTERFETAPGHQAQFDWSPYTVCLGGKVVKVIIFSLILGFSRRVHYWASLDETQGSIFEAIEAGLQHFGGSPKELLIDNARAFVVDARPDLFVWNRRFLELCGHYSIEPRACQPARPRTKGKVERPFYYLEQHFIKGRTWQDFGDFARALSDFVADDIDLRIHSTTGERPIDRFREEAPLLTPLPPNPFIGTHETLRKVSWDCLLSYMGSRYSVPWAYAGKQVWLRTSQGRTLIVRNQKGEGIARHALAPKKGATVIDQSHYEGLRQRVAKTRPLVEGSFLKHFPDHEWFMEGVCIQQKNNPLDHLRGILQLAEVYPRDEVTRAFAVARECNAYSHRIVRGLLESGTLGGAQPGSIAAPEPTCTALAADLEVYQQILEAAS